jgi:hypothetical protein
MSIPGPFHARLALAVSGKKVLRLKPQDLLVNLPLATTS